MTIDEFFKNGARLPRDGDNVKDGKSVTWIVIVCVGVVLLLLITGVVGFCIFMRFKSTPIKSDDRVQRASKRAISPKANSKPSPMNTLVD
uniref:Uncharacterized protein n=1 Tax=Panagrellus redivivus TaxID=6233 RepID=A0A7E4WCJ7_PANRE